MYSLLNLFPVILNSIKISKVTMRFFAIFSAICFSINGQEKEIASPIKKVDRFARQIEEWSEEWIGQNGKVGYYERYTKVSARLNRVKTSFKKNIVICNPEYAGIEDSQTEDESSGEDVALDVRGTCFNSTCAVTQSFTVLHKFESLLSTFVGCEHPNNSVSMDVRREGLSNKLVKLKRVVLRGICTAFVEKNEISTDCNDLSDNLDHQYDEVINLLTNGLI